MNTAAKYELTDGRHVWTRCLEDIDDASTDVKVYVHNCRLIMNIKGQHVEDLPLPSTAFTGDARAFVQRGVLLVDMSYKDPSAPAMVEKALLNPDLPHPRELPLVVLGHGLNRGSGVPNKEDPTRRNVTNASRRLFDRLGIKAVVPQSNLSSTAATDMPIITNPEAAVEAAADNGETVVVDPQRSDTKTYVDQVEQIAERLGRAELAPAGTTVVRGAHDKELEAEYDQGSTGEKDLGADQYNRKIVDYTEEKVGLMTRPLEPRDVYTTSESSVEPYSSVKVKAGEDPGLACDMCRCAPCQCDKVDKSFPYELSPQEQKRSAKPAAHATHKAVTGHNTHLARDFKLHSKLRSDEHAQAESRTRENVGGVSQEGVDPQEELPASGREKQAHMTVGGRAIDPEMLRDRTRIKETARHFLG